MVHPMRKSGQFWLVLAFCIAARAVSGQSIQALPPPRPLPPPLRAPSPLRPSPGGPPIAAVERLGPNLYAIGRLRVDAANREVSVSGRSNDVTTLEFVANSMDGHKAYESALTLDTNAVAFNTALLLIGLDVKHAKVPTQHFDPVAPQGDPVEIWVEWTSGSDRKRVRAEQLLFDKRTNQPLPEGPWVYTGSSFLGPRYLAELDGVLIGFVHSPSPIIENPRAGAVNAYGSVVFNKSLGLPPNTPVTLFVRALPASP